jgi:hypothetical protein
MSHCNRTIVFQVGNRTACPSESMSHRSHHESESSDCHTTISQESLEALVNVGDGGSDGSFPSGKGWNPFAFLSDAQQESTPALTVCSSRSSLQDLDSSVDDGFDYFRDQQHSIELPYLNDEGSNTPGSYLPSVLRRSSPRSVSFSGIETVFGAEETVAADESQTVLRYPKTPSIEWYSSSGGSSQRTLQGTTLPRHAFPPLASSSRRNPQLQPRRSALKKQDRGGGSVPGTEVSFIHIPLSPKITWYSSKR